LRSQLALRFWSGSVFAVLKPSGCLGDEGCFSGCLCDGSCFFWIPGSCPLLLCSLVAPLLRPAVLSSVLVPFVGVLLFLACLGDGVIWKILVRNLPTQSR
jgi:hypothetical protein